MPERQGPSPAALRFATRLTEQQFRDVYGFANLIDMAFEAAIEEAKEEERQRLFSLGFWAICREYWRGRTFKTRSLA